MDKLLIQNRNESKAKRNEQVIIFHFMALRRKLYATA